MLWNLKKNFTFVGVGRQGRGIWRKYVKEVRFSFLCIFFLSFSFSFSLSHLSISFYYISLSFYLFLFMSPFLALSFLFLSPFSLYLSVYLILSIIFLSFYLSLHNTFYCTLSPLSFTSHSQCVCALFFVDFFSSSVLSITAPFVGGFTEQLRKLQEEVDNKKAELARRMAQREQFSTPPPSSTLMGAITTPPPSFREQPLGRKIWF